MAIHALSDEVSSAIAAGEVVERPSSIVKELIENSLDAGATTIQVQIIGGGKSLIEVADNGSGIPHGELKLAIERYSTSKLDTIDDLRAIRTLGFRGEALASIAAVSRMVLTTRPVAEPVGTRLQVDGGRVGETEAAGTSEGTTVQVKDLFYNVPARKRFLKSDTTERGWISRLVTRYAMAYPERRFEFASDGRIKLQTSGNGDPLEVLAEVYGLEVAQQMIPIPTASSERITVSGFVGAPFVNRSNRREITLFVNGRWIQDVSLGSAVTQAYHTFLMGGRYPIALLDIEVPPEGMDVNVHPAKAEIRFENPGLVFSIVQRAVRATLLGQSPIQPVSVGPIWSGDRFPQTFDTSDPVERTLEPAAQSTMAVPILRSVGQVGATYLVAEGPDGVYLIDQHAAHERVLFDKLMAQVGSELPESQGLLQAETVELTEGEAELVESKLGALEALGFAIEPFGARAYRVRAVPAAVSNLSPERALRVVIDDFEEDETPLAAETEARLAARVCKRAAIKAGQVMSLEEQRQLISDLEQSSSPRTCPHGRPTMVHLSVAALERQFGRRG
ncbi:MAG: DNA mismatch repair endonuclease MutL [Anaerolineales bacterium]